MTQLDVAADVEHLRDAVRDLARTRIAPQAAEAEAQVAVPADVLRGLNELGVLSPLDTESAHVFDVPAMLLVAEELGSGDPGVAYEVMQGAYAALFAAQFGPGATRDALLAGAGAGALPPLGSLWLYEGFGLGPDEYATTFTRTDDGWTVSGTKIGVVRPGTAEFAVVLGRTGDGSSIAALLGPEQLARAAVIRDDKAGKLGLVAAHTGNLRLAGVPVPAEAVLTDRMRVARFAAAARLASAAIAVGTGEASLRYAGAYAQTREAFGQVISSYQGVVFPLAEGRMKLDGARQAITDLGLRLDGSTDATQLSRETAHAVAAAHSAALFATIHGLNTLGGHGFLADHPCERWYRSAGTLAALDTDPLVRA